MAQHWVSGFLPSPTLSSNESFSSWEDPHHSLLTIWGSQLLFSFSTKPASSSLSADKQIWMIPQHHEVPLSGSLWSLEHGACLCKSETGWGTAVYSQSSWIQILPCRVGESSHFHGSAIFSLLSSKVSGPCHRCQVICIDQHTGQRNQDVFQKLSETRERKVSMIAKYNTQF